MKTHVIQVDGYDCYIGLAEDDFVKNMVSIQVNKGRQRIGETKVFASDDLEDLHRRVVLKVRKVVLAGLIRISITSQDNSIEIDVDQGLKNASSEILSYIMEDAIKREDYEMAGRAKKILDQRNQP